MGEYQRKPDKVQAIQYTGHNLAEVALFVKGKIEPTYLSGPGRGMSKSIKIHTSEGFLSASEGTWLVKRSTGELFKCDAKSFESTYTPISVDK